MGNNIKQLRKKFGISQAELARRLDFSRSYMNILENNVKQPNSVTALRIANILGCTLNDIFFEEDGNS